MMLDTKKLSEFLEREQWDEAGNLITAYLDSIELTEEQKGAAYLQFAQTYLGVMNTLSDEYEANLDAAIAGLKKLNAVQKDLNNKIDLARVKNEVKKMAA